MKTVINVYSGTTVLGSATEYIVTVFGAESQGITDAPANALKYLRSNSEWVVHKDVTYLQESMPLNPLEGDIWFNPTTQQIKVFENTSWRSLSTDGGHF